jgi:hypothetical protein
VDASLGPEPDVTRDLSKGELRERRTFNIGRFATVSTATP